MIPLKCLLTLVFATTVHAPAHLRLTPCLMQEAVVGLGVAESSGYTHIDDYWINRGARTGGADLTVGAFDEGDGICCSPVQYTGRVRVWIHDRKVAVAFAFAKDTRQLFTVAELEFKPRHIGTISARMR